MAHLVVTAIDRPYLPGLIALHNSILRNSPGTDMACLTYGDDDLAAEVRARGIEVVHNADINAHLPPGEDTVEGCKPMYARLLVPMLFDDCMWLDADQIVLTDLAELFAMKFAEPVAAVPSIDIQATVRGMTTPAGVSIYSGLMLFNVPEWRRQRITERCLELMNTPNGVFYRFVVQSVVSVVLAGSFHRLDPKWQGWANRSKLDVADFKVWHWHGRTKKPWTHDMPNAEVWREYAQ